MGRFRDAKTVDASRFILKFEDNKSYVLKVIEPDYIEQWSEVWPTFPMESGRTMRRFVADSDFKNVRSVLDYRKSTDLDSLFKKAGVTDENNRKRMVNNWKCNRLNAMIVIIGIEQKVKNAEDKFVNKIVWDKEAKIWSFSSSTLTKITAINHNPDNIERAEKAGKEKLTMCNPDDSETSGYFCHDIYALRVTKMKIGVKRDYVIETGKLIGIMSKKDIVNIKMVKDSLLDHIKPTAISEVEEFLNDNIGASGSSKNEAEYVEETVVEDAPKEKVSTDDNISIEEDVADTKPKSSSKPSKTSEEVSDDIEDIDVIEIDEL